MPAVTPKVNWEVTSTTDTIIGSTAAKIKNMIGHVDNSGYPQIKVDIQLTVTMPARVTKPVPVIMEFGFIFPPGFQVSTTTGRYANSKKLAGAGAGKRLGMCGYCAHQLSAR